MAQLLYLSTLGGAEVCGLESKIGNFEEGKEFDAILVNVSEEAGNPTVWYKKLDESDKDEELSKSLERFFFCGDERNIMRVWVKGIQRGGKQPAEN